MSELRLIIGNRNYSSWSMRAWVALRGAGIPFEDEVIWLDTESSGREKTLRSPAGRVPILENGDITVWDSLAISEYVAELHPDLVMWPEDRVERARARALCAEMHAGFAALRAEIPLNCKRDRPLRDGVSRACEADIARAAAIFATARSPYMFGAFGIADAFFAPVASRLRSYRIPLDGPAAHYATTLLSAPAVEEWTESARREKHTLRYDEIP